MSAFESSGQSFCDEAVKQSFYSRHEPGLANAFQAAVVAIAGAGGLGSNVAVLLARAGIGHLIIADFDVVKTHNLNRQQFYLDQVGQPKVTALKNNLVRQNLFSKYDVFQTRLTAGNIPLILGPANILIEALDSVDSKLELAESWLTAFPDKPLVVNRHASLTQHRHPA